MLIQVIKANMLEKHKYKLVFHFYNLSDFQLKRARCIEGYTLKNFPLHG